jgi:hypothetical protein
MLMDGSSCVWTVDQLRHHVHDTLCRQENLVAQQFELQTIALTRLGVRCGLQFLLRGPRSVRLGAVWTADQNQIYFYNARGERFLKQPLEHAVAFDSEAMPDEVTSAVA